ncbi:MAG: hypothetical protein R6W91_03125 [Thermoplasmata archaeon]
MAKEVTSAVHKPYENMWVLKTDDMIKNLTWWWWWWIFFIKDPDNPGKTKQLMILWSTKYSDDIMVMDHKWSVSKLPAWEDGALKFNGMVAAWWFDGKQMHDPIVLEEADFEVRHDGDEGELNPILKGTDYRFFGGPKNYTVNIKDKDNDFHFEMTPWNDYLLKHRFNENQYTKKYSYNIMKIFGMKLKGTIRGKPIEGSAYHQRVTVNAPAPPWYWGLVHCEDGSYIDYFMPYIGPQIFRSTDKPTSWLDFCDIRMNKSIHFYHKPTNTEYRFNTKHTRIRHKVVDGLPAFEITGKDNEKEFFLRLKAYTRAYWRFQQPRKMGMKSILYYNEYPAIVDEFRFRKLDGSLEVGKKNLGFTACNFEHSWGKLI